MSDEKSKVEIADKDVTKLAPFVQTRLALALNECHDAGYPVVVCEAYRTPQRQDWLYESGRTRKGKIVTRAKAWQSWHQYGVGLDLSFSDGRKMWWPKSDDPIWDRVHDIFARFGFEDLTFERAHVQITCGMFTGDARALMSKSGIESVWQLIETRLNKNG